MAKKASIVDGVRLRALRELKGFRTQGSLAKIVGVPQPHICDLESGKLRNPEVFVRVADTLDCTTDFLFHRGPYASIRSDDELRLAASQMSFDVFAARKDTSAERREWCRRTLPHRDAPVTADGWATLSEQIEMALGPTQVGPRLFDRKRGR